ncbi:TetR/AcrR family transcriptional regulator [Streptomyces adelaidensis]|uniref:TetR/AcrR family transcriptional regulator n=1 Tax=Streptomyces adelaidensis TaxID=2796465 RepID=UPI001908C69B|nr:TetR/AcrR family transcriptional regulator [Streptomyces adelaidensis]
MPGQERPHTETAPQGRRGKRGKILDAAVELFLGRGFDQTSMDAVAEQAGVSKTTVYAHFGDKVALFGAVIERGGASLDFDLDQTMFSSVDDPGERLAHIVTKLLEATTAPDSLAFLRVLTTETARRPELIEAVSSLGVPHVVDVTAATLREDALRHGYTLPDPDAYASLFVRMAAAGPQMDALLAPGSAADSARHEAQARWVTSLFLRALRTRGADALPAVPDALHGHVFPWLSGNGA